MNLEHLTSYLKREWGELVTQAIRPRPEQTPERREAELIRRAAGSSAARQFLESEDVREFMASAEARLTHELLALPLEDDAGRRALAVAIQTQRQLWKWLAAKAQDGLSAEQELERLKKPVRAFF